MSERQAPNDDNFKYEPVDHPRWKWRTTEEYSISSNLRLGGIFLPRFHWDWVSFENGVITIPAEYHWNGANWPAIDTPSIIRASCVHDALYQAITAEAMSRNFKDDSDLAFYRICRDDGMWRFRAWYAYQAVKMFGSP